MRHYRPSKATFGLLVTPKCYFIIYTCMQIMDQTKNAKKNSLSFEKLDNMNQWFIQLNVLWFSKCNLCNVYPACASSISFGNLFNDPMQQLNVTIFPWRSAATSHGHAGLELVDGNPDWNQEEVYCRGRTISEGTISGNQWNSWWKLSALKQPIALGVGGGGDAILPKCPKSCYTALSSRWKRLVTQRNSCTWKWRMRQLHRGAHMWEEYF